jgi:hypothetical protein
LIIEKKTTIQDPKGEFAKSRKNRTNLSDCADADWSEAKSEQLQQLVDQVYTQKLNTVLLSSIEV